jgi:hypothetical protein
MGQQWETDVPHLCLLLFLRILKAWVSQRRYKKKEFAYLVKKKKKRKKEKRIGRFFFSDGAVQAQGTNKK